MELSQRPELRHKVTLSPQVYQGLNILAMPIADLQQLIEVEMLENPVLEVDETENEPSEEEPVDERDDERSWDEWLEMYEDLDTVEQTAPRDPNAESTNTEEFVGGVQSFDDYLVDQIALLSISEPVARAARLVVGSLDDDGFFVGSLDEVAALAGVSVAEAEAGLKAVQQLDPPGSRLETWPKPCACRWSSSASTSRTCCGSSGSISTTSQPTIFARSPGR